MEKNNYNNQLDDFVQKSFDDYEENPSSNMWDRIEADLPTKDNKRPLVWWWTNDRLRWAAAAAMIVLVGSTVLCIRYYYEQKILAIERAHQEGIKANQYGTVPNIAPMPSRESTTQDTSISTPVLTEKDATPSLSRPNKPKNIVPIATQTDRLMTNPVSGQSRPLPSPPSREKIVANQIQTPNKVVTNDPKNIEPTASQPDAAPPAIADLALLPMALIPTVRKQVLDDPQGVIHLKAVALDFSSKPSIIPVKKHLNWYIGISGTPRLLVRQGKPPAATTPSPGQRPRYRAEQDGPDLSSDIWVRGGVQFQSPFGIETGIGFQNVERQSNHKVRFAYREGTFIPSTGTRSKQFNYDLNTYGGEASVTLRTEENTAQSPGDDEAIRATIVSKEQIQLLHVPLLGVVRLGQHKTQLVIKAGLQGSWFLKNEVAVSTFDLNASRLRPLPGRGISLVYDKPNTFKLGYAVSAGIEYRLNQHWRLLATPAMSGYFKQKSGAGNKNQGNFTAGLHLGTQYWF